MSAIEQITELTDEHRAIMRDVIEEWVDHGLMTGDANRRLFKDACRRCYEASDLKWHDNVIWVDNPLIGGYVTYILSEDFRPEIVDELIRAVSIQLKMINDSEENISKEINDLAKDAIKNKKFSWNQIGGQLWVGGWWGPAYVDFFKRIGLKLDDKTNFASNAYADTCKSASWWWPYDNFTVACERPLEIHLEKFTRDGREVSRLHNENGPAVVFRGWSIYEVHGVRVPGWIVETPEKITVEDIDKEQNAEVRRVMIDFYGMERYLLDSNSEEIDKSEWGTLYRRELEEDEPIVAVHVINSSKEPDGSYKKYMIRVPPEITTAREAIAWSFGIEKETEYNPIRMT